MRRSSSSETAWDDGRERVVQGRAVLDRHGRNRDAVDVGDDPVAVPRAALAQRRETLELVTARAQPQLDRGPHRLGLPAVGRGLPRTPVPSRLAVPVRDEPLCEVIGELRKHVAFSSLAVVPSNQCS